MSSQAAKGLLSEVYPVLLAGGTGTRLWPVSRALYPKQLVKFTGNLSLVQATVKRLVPPLDADKVRLVCGREHFHEIARHMEEIGITGQGSIIAEPCGRNTAPAILLAVLSLLERQSDAIVCVFPADHVIRDVDAFHSRLNAAIRLAEQNYIVTFGIQPHYPETGYGYIEGATAISDGARCIARFVEKPDRQTAEHYLQSGNFYWNSGMFTFRASVMLAEFERYQPAMLKQMRKLDLAAGPNEAQYRQLDDISIDYAVMEHTRKGAVLASDFGWSDIGSWKSLYDFLPKDSNENVAEGDVILKDTSRCCILSYQRLIATNHLQGIVVVETPDSIFVSDLDNSRDVKSIVSQLKEKGRDEYRLHRTVYHPWGNVTLLEKGDNHEVKRLEVYPDRQFEWPSVADARRQVTVIAGRADIASDRSDRQLACGQVLVPDPTVAVTIRNAGPEPLGLLTLTLTGPAAARCRQVKPAGEGSEK
jgi:mannose-1-phosphate guanylyltransferase/mannose-6-phosphate isomerase